MIPIAANQFSYVYLITDLTALLFNNRVEEKITTSFGSYSI